MITEEKVVAKYTGVVYQAVCETSNRVPNTMAFKNVTGDPNGEPFLLQNLTDEQAVDLITGLFNLANASRLKRSLPAFALTYTP